MTKSKQPDYLSGDYLMCEGLRLTIKEKVKQAVFLVVRENGLLALMTLSELARYEHLRVVPRPAHRPKGSGKKTVKLETIPPESTANRPTITGEFPPSPTPEAVPPPSRPFVGGIPQGMGNPDKQASTPEEVSPTLEEVPPTPAHTDKAPKNEPVPFDPATFTMKVGTGTYQHLMTASGKPFYGKELRPTLIRLLKDFGITGSPAELKAKLVLDYPDSQGLREMLSILKGGTVRKE